MPVYIPHFQVLRGRPRFFLPSGFQWIIIFGSRVGSILSTWPYQLSCFRVMSSNIISCASIFPLIYSFVFLSSLEIIADRLNASISVALILLLSSSFKPLNPELNPICYLLAILGAHHFLHVSRIKVKLLTFRLLMLYIYIYIYIYIWSTHSWCF